MRKLHSVAAICTMLIGTMPVVASAQANHNTARSNKSTVAAPAEDAVPAENAGEAQRAGRKGYDHYQAQSDMAPVSAGSASSGQSADDNSVAGATVPRQTQGATFGERVNAGTQQPGSPAPDRAPAQTRPQGL